MVDCFLYICIYSLLPIFYSVSFVFGFCARGINLKKLIFIGIANFIPFILNDPIRTFVYEILKNHISDKVLLLDLYIFLKETVFWICKIILINLIVSTSIESSSMDETVILDNSEKS